MITDKESTVGIRVYSKILNCAEISKALDLKPSEKFEIGELFGGRFNKRPREESLWVYDLDLDKRMLFEEQLKNLVDVVLTRKKNFLNILNECQVDIFCGYTTYNGQGGFTLDAAVMKEIAPLNINISIDLYALNNTFEQGVIKPKDKT